MKKEEKEEAEPKVDEEPIEEKPEEPAETVEEAKTEELTEEVPEEEAKAEGAEEKAEAKEEAPTPAEEEKKPSKEEKEKAKKKEEEEIVEERIYTVPLGKAWIMPANKRAPRAMRMLKAFITKHMKLEAHKETEGEEEEEPSRLIIDNDVNLRLWNRGIEKPPRKIRVRAAKDKEGNVTVYLAEGD
jgi:large subunit ribosomal protein L31e